MNYLKILSSLILIVVSSRSANAVERNNTEQNKLNDLSFMVGAWRSQNASGQIDEENWSAPEGDSMLSYFRSVSRGKTKAYEVNAIVQTELGIVMKLKHFREGFVAWDEQEEPGDCRLLRCSKDEAIFENSKDDHKLKLTYRRTSPDSLYTSVEVERSGKKMNFPIQFKLVK